MNSRLALIAFCIATPLLVPLAWWIPGLVAWGASVVFLVRSRDAVLQRRLGVLLGSVLILALVPIGTDLSNHNFLMLGSAFLAALLLPYFALRRHDPDVIVYRLVPKRISWTEVLYVLLSIPIAWIVVELYFFKINPQMPRQWPLPQVPDAQQIVRLIVGINGVGIWDELFFINTVYAVLRTIFPRRWANLAQAVVYTSVLNDMAFIGIGPILVYTFAVIQGVMYERTRVLLYVLVVHLIVDAFLVIAILHHYYPGAQSHLWF